MSGRGGVLPQEATGVRCPPAARGISRHWCEFWWSQNGRRAPPLL